MHLQPAIIKALPRCTNTGTVLKFFRFERFLNFQGQNQKCCLNYDLRSEEAWNRALVGSAVDKKVGQVCSRVESASLLIFCHPFYLPCPAGLAQGNKKSKVQLSCSLGPEPFDLVVVEHPSCFTKEHLIALRSEIFQFEFFICSCILLLQTNIYHFGFCPHFSVAFAAF